MLEHLDARQSRHLDVQEEQLGQRHGLEGFDKVCTIVKYGRILFSQFLQKELQFLGGQRFVFGYKYPHILSVSLGENFLDALGDNLGLDLG